MSDKFRDPIENLVRLRIGLHVGRSSNDSVFGVWYHIIDVTTGHHFVSKLCRQLGGSCMWPLFAFNATHSHAKLCALENFSRKDWGYAGHANDFVMVVEVFENFSNIFIYLHVFTFERKIRKIFGHSKPSWNHKSIVIARI